MKILLTGQNGQVGWALSPKLAALGELCAVDLPVFDLARPDTMAALLREFKPDVIINPAAYTAVDRAESERDAAFAVNGVAPGLLAEEARRLGALLIHYSTDYVFDGGKETPYVESDSPAPLNVYGASKLEGERAIAAAGCRHLILRTSWVYGTHGQNFLLSMLKLGRERPQLRVVDDQIGAPTWAGSLAEMTLALLQDEIAGRAVSGLYHATDGGETSWYGFAQEIFKHATIETAILPIPTSEYPTPAPRPRNSRLNNDKRLAVSSTQKQRAWRECLSDCMRAAREAQGR